MRKTLGRRRTSSFCRFGFDLDSWHILVGGLGGDGLRYIPDLELTVEERALFDRINLSDKLETGVPGLINAEVVPALMSMLLSRGAIPAHRLEYFNEPQYALGQNTSYRGRFELNGNSEDEMYGHYSFRKFLRYFLCGADLPGRVMVAFRKTIASCDRVSPSDVPDLERIAVKLMREYDLQPHVTADEFLRLSLDEGVHSSHVIRLFDYLRKVRI